MAHKLAQKWSCWVLYDNDLTQLGTMDLRTMDEYGNLEQGSHTDPDADPPTVGIRGKATRLGLGYHLVLENEDQTVTYVGQLIQESPDEKLILVGTKLYSSAKARIAAGLNQDDPPWIITKP
jgi:hypothetical protein